MTKIKYLLMVAVMAIGIIKIPVAETKAIESCPELKIIFMRGSGGTRWTDPNYLDFKASLEEKLALVDLEYEFLDLDYPAVGVGLDNLFVTLGAFFGGGEAYEFGESVAAGVSELIRVVNTQCPNTKYVLGGYSQGAMVLSKALPNLNAEKIVYAATFGDPKIYLPEGAGAVPAACANRDLSEYRAYVPDCQAYEGLLGSYRPYQPEGFSGKLGTWCNKYDIFCSSYFSLSSHTAYIEDDLYEDASKMIFSKITDAFQIENRYVSAHDTALLLDITGSMKDAIKKSKTEILNLAEQIFEARGRVAFYGYGDLNEMREPIEYCNFETCTREKIEAALSNIEVEGGGDRPESLLSSALTAMRKLTWRQGSTKSLVVFTDAGFHSPDLDGTSFMDVVNLSKQIDPVNFYIETFGAYDKELGELTRATDGRVFTNIKQLPLLTEAVVTRFDSLPRVEESAVFGEGPERPTLVVWDVREVSEGEVEISFKSSGGRALLVLNEAALGIVEGEKVTLTGLNREMMNEVLLVPLSDTRRGEGVLVKIGSSEIEWTRTPKAPDTGIVKISATN